MNHIAQMYDLVSDPKLFETFRCGTALEELLGLLQGLPRDANYMRENRRKTVCL